MNESEKYRLKVTYPDRCEAKRREYILESGRREAAQNLYRLIIEEGDYCTVKITEEDTKYPQEHRYSFDLPRDETRIEIEITQVQHRLWTMPSYAPAEPQRKVGRVENIGKAIDSFIEGLRDKMKGRRT